MKKGYIGYSRDDKVRGTSTSGGICQQISRYIISRGGIVCGVCFDEDFNLIRDFAYTEDDLQKMNKSKYIQARQGNSYKNLKAFLECGKEVLFVGTPCDVAGIKGYLGKEYHNLYCIDFVCLGIPSSKAWKVYIQEIQKNRKLAHIDFKNKCMGWKNFTFVVEFNDGTKFSETGRKNIYMKTMLDKLDCRPSCYSCHFRTLDRLSDLTVADAWGVEEIAGELLDDKGTSSIMVNSEKGKKLIEAISKDCVLKEMAVERLWSGNKSINKQYDRPHEREQFYSFLGKYGFIRTVKIIKGQKLINKIKKKLFY